MKNLPIYCFEGTAKIICERCHTNHSLIFSGGDGETVSQAIEDALELEGWGSNPVLCPDCYQEYGGEPLVFDDEENELDDLDDFDLEDD
jgi:hypothetical protein